MKIYFIHGLGEKNDVFRAIAPQLSGDHQYISLWESLGDKKRSGFDVLEFAKEVIDKFNIQKSDIIIGHSTGGRLAYYIKYLNDNTVIQIASWTKDGKPVLPIASRKVLYFLVQTGILFTKPVMNHMFDTYRNRDNTKPYYKEAFQNLKEGNRNAVLSQFKLALEPVKEEINTSPDLRIHAKKDNIVKYPDEEFIEVPGDHFSLLTHPDIVAGHIKQFLSQNY